MPSRLPFDRVILAANGTRKELSTAAFLRMPLHLRISHILQREVEFFAGQEPVDRRTALTSLRRWTESGEG